MSQSNFPKKLNLGSGQFPREGFLNVDFSHLANPDLIMDLNDPKNMQVLPSGHFELIVLDHVLEHLGDTFGIMKQIHRLLQPGGVVEIRVPHFSRGFMHPEHQRGFDVTFPEYMNPRFKGGYIGVPFRPVSVKLEYIIRFDMKAPYVGKIQLIILKIMNKVLTWSANLNTNICSRFWCFWVGGFEQVEFILKKPK